ncbi:L-asparaginase-like isoform X1 [Acipenser ruthenus]|uniref:L-asparaginase-like isoform X1 n=1 Tax=Acipenser ruthenus TaxID=7906 RepID=UPI00145BD4AD|nr:L-asparaginase-like isoform X1 [Acipenser ruthenus]
MPFKWPINPAKKARQRKKIQEDNLRFWGAVASSVRLGWLGLIDRNKEKKVILQSLFPLLMCTAAMEGDIEGLEGHLNQGADAQMTSNYGRTPLHVAAGEGDLDTVRFLLKKGADISYRDDFREPALNDAIRSKNLEVVEHLVSEGAYLEILPGALGGEMCCLAYLNDTKQMEIWMAAGKHLNYADYDKRTPLHVAVCTNQAEMVTFCLNNGSDPELRDFHNNRPLEDARRLGFKYMEELLLADQARRQAVAEEEERLRELQAEIEKDAEELLQ